jgi:hypothetical protein
MRSIVSTRKILLHPIIRNPHISDALTFGHVNIKGGCSPRCRPHQGLCALSPSVRSVGIRNSLRRRASAQGAGAFLSKCVTGAKIPVRVTAGRRSILHNDTIFADPVCGQTHLCGVNYTSPVLPTSISRAGSAIHVDALGCAIWDDQTERRRHCTDR